MSNNEKNLAHLGSLMNVHRVNGTRRGLMIPNDFSEEEWRHLFKDLLSGYDGIGFWLGDALLFAQDRMESKQWGDKYRLTQEATGYNYTTLANFVWVCRAVQFSRRRESLSFSHHTEVACMEAAEQERWLKEAEANQWTVADLRAAIRAKDVQQAKADRPGRTWVAMQWVNEGLRNLRRIAVHTMSQRQKTALKQELEPIVKLYETL